MKRSGIKRKTPMKSRRPKVDPAEKRIRDSARDENCTLMIEPGLVCRNRTDTVVYCHSNKLVDGKGSGLKAKIGCYGCFECHNVLDGRSPPPAGMTYEDVLERFYQACEKTRQILTTKGLI